eukprot:m.364147 g.364147  ORF g.364147 m.364147 type:complete len:57 (+) comp25771_c0_seq1:182-352(+)
MSPTLKNSLGYQEPEPLCLRRVGSLQHVLCNVCVCVCRLYNVSSLCIVVLLDSCST